MKKKRGGERGGRRQRQYIRMKLYSANIRLEMWPYRRLGWVAGLQKRRCDWKSSD